jgi:hypothetical protein
MGKLRKIIVLQATLIAIYSSPEKQSYTDRFGNGHQVVEFLFRVDEWTGIIERGTDENLNAEFFPIDALPEAFNEFFPSITMRFLMTSKGLAID